MIFIPLLLHGLEGASWSDLGYAAIVVLAGIGLLGSLSRNRY